MASICLLLINLQIPHLLTIPPCLLPIPAHPKSILIPSLADLLSPPLPPTFLVYQVRAAGVCPKVAPAHPWLQPLPPPLDPNRRGAPVGKQAGRACDRVLRGQRWPGGCALPACWPPSLHQSLLRLWPGFGGSIACVMVGHPSLPPGPRQRPRTYERSETMVTIVDPERDQEGQVDGGRSG